MPQRKPSTTTTPGSERRQRRFDDRGARIQVEATRLFLERGLGGFSMEDVASAIDYSKGTVYQHYTSKEDVLLAVLTRHLETVTIQFENAATAPVRPRARMRAIAELDLAHTIANPEVLLLQTAFVSPAVLAKAPAERQKAVDEFYGRQNATERGIVRDAISRGDLTLPAGRRPDSVTYALSAMYFGSMYIASQGAWSRHFTLEQMKPQILVNVETVMDGFAWKPLSDSPEYAAEIARLQETLFGSAPAGAAPQP